MATNFAAEQTASAFNTTTVADTFGVKVYDNETKSEGIDPQDLATCKLFSFIVYTIIVGSLCILGGAGNIVCFMVFWSDKIKTSTSFLFQGLSLIDTILLATVFPMYSLTDFVQYTGWMKSYTTNVEPYVFVYVLPFTFIAQTSTIWVTVLVAVNRYIAVCKPYQASRLCTVNQARKQLAIVLIFAVLYNVPKFPAAKIVTKVGENNATHIEAGHTYIGDSKLYQIIYNNFLYLIFLLILPLLILTLLNIRLIRTLNEIKRRRAEMQTLRQQQDNNVTFVLIIVVLVFTVCQLPALVNQILWYALPDEVKMCNGFMFYFSRICNMLVILNSSVNFVIYFFCNTRFRHVLITTICKRDIKDNEKEKEKKINNGKSVVGDAVNDTNETTQTLL